jgi:hypothetical protein
MSNESPVPTTISKVRQTRINDNPRSTLSRVDDRVLTSKQMGTQSTPSTTPNTTINVAEQQNNTTTNHQRKFIALCIDTREHYTSLGEINASTITKDSNLFKEIKNKYHALRGFKLKAMKLFLFEPQDIRFVQVCASYFEMS